MGEGLKKAKKAARATRGSRDKYIIVRLTKAEKDFIEEASEAKSLDRSGYSRMELLEAAQRTLGRLFQ